MTRHFAFDTLFIVFHFAVQDQKVGTEIYDINNDGHSDAVRLAFEGGSAFGGNYCSLVNGKITVCLMV